MIEVEASIKIVGSIETHKVPEKTIVRLKSCEYDDDLVILVVNGSSVTLNAKDLREAISRVESVSRDH